MKLSVIVAVSSNHVIGYKNQLPWRLPADLKYFKQVTMGHPIVMGRKTYESIGRPLPGRTNIIITRQENYEVQNCIVVHSFEEAMSLCREEDEVFIIGGAEIILQSIQLVDKIYLTRISGVFAGDTFFPEIDHTQWSEIQRQDFEPDEKNAWPYSFIIYERVPALLTE